MFQLLSLTVFSFYLNVILSWYLDRSCEGVPLLPEHVPPAQVVAVVGQVDVVGSRHVHHDDVAGKEDGEDVFR